MSPLNTRDRSGEYHIGTDLLDAIEMQAHAGDVGAGENRHRARSAQETRCDGPVDAVDLSGCKKTRAQPRPALTEDAENAAFAQRRHRRPQIELGVVRRTDLEHLGDLVQRLKT